MLIKSSFLCQYLVALVCGMLAAIVIWLLLMPAAVSGVVFSGPLSHDFGDVEFQGTPEPRRHTFELINQSEHTFRIGKVAATCGCTVADARQESVAPGDVLQIDVELTFPESGFRSEIVTVYLEGYGVLNLTVEGRAVAPVAFAAVHRSISPPTRIGEIANCYIRGMTIDTLSAEAIPVPEIHCTPEFRATFVGWAQLLPADSIRGKPAIWLGEIAVELREQHVDDDWAFLTCSFQDGTKIYVDLSGRPWRTNIRVDISENEAALATGRPFRN